MRFRGSVFSFSDDLLYYELLEEDRYRKRELHRLAIGYYDDPQNERPDEEKEEEDE